VEQGKLIPVSQEVVFHKNGYERMVADVQQVLQNDGEISAAQMRDHWDTSRRYVLAFLEYLDRIGVTVRDGDIRRLRK